MVHTVSIDKQGGIQPKNYFKILKNLKILEGTKNVSNPHS